MLTIRSRSSRMFWLTVAALTLSAACAAPSTTNDRAVEQTPGAATTPSVSADVRPAPPASKLPAVEVLDVPTGSPVALQDLAPAPQPLLLWFWAPH